jgi:peptidyl-prolyl cis-trans isomerase SurA
MQEPRQRLRPSRRAPRLAVCACFLVVAGACGKDKKEDAPAPAPTPVADLVWVRHILVRFEGTHGATPDTRSRASADSLVQALQARLVAGEDFRALAKEYSDDPSAEDGGEIAPLEPGDGPPEFMAAAANLKPGEISPVVESSWGYHIIQRRDMNRCTAQHILVQWKGAVGAPDSIQRTREEALARIERILAEVRNPDSSFPVAAREYSDDARSAPTGGNLGTFVRDTMDRRFEAAAFALQEGQISDIVETPYGFHIIRRISDTTVRVAHIMVTFAGVGQLVEDRRSRDEALRRALDAAFRAKQGEDFTALVQEYSDDAASAKRGGVLPPLRAGQAAPEFEDAAFRLRPGEVSDVVETEFGFHVIKRIW